jgi:DNA polymerase I-like protein with 3'-5' exonuclease and polymerase domains
MSGDAHLIDAYAQGKDIYAWIAEKIYNIPYDECKEFRPDGTRNPDGKKRRDSVKSVILGIMYGRGARAISEQLNCSVKEAQGVVDQFYNTFPKVKEWMNSVLENARKYGFVETAWGRKRRLPDVQLEPYEFTPLSGGASTFDPLNFDSPGIVPEVPFDVREKYTLKLKKAWGRSSKVAIIQEARSKGIGIKDNGGYIADAERQCVNSIIQGTSADMVKLSMVSIGNSVRLKELDCHLIIQVHDEIIVECPEEHAKECSEIVSNLMIESAKDKISVPMKCDAEITRSWYGEEVKL